MRGQIGEGFTQVQPGAGVVNVAKILLVGVINVQIDADEDDEEYEEDQVQHGAGVANVAKILLVGVINVQIDAATKFFEFVVEKSTDFLYGSPAKNYNPLLTHPKYFINR